MDANVEWTDPEALLSRLKTPGAHVVQFFPDDASLVDVLGHFVVTGLAAGDAVVAIATDRHLDACSRYARARGEDLARAAAEGRYVGLDAAAVLATFMAGGRPIATRFADSVGDVIARAGGVGARGHVRAFGEMVALLWADGLRDGALRLEDLWNDLSLDLPFGLLCAYPDCVFDDADDASALLDICGRHSQAASAARPACDTSRTPFRGG